MKNNFKRCLALLLALMSIVGSFAIPVSAADGHVHNWTEYKKVEPTCTSRGYTTYFCADCGEYETTNLVDKLSHNYVKMTEGKDATCLTPGYKPGAYVCTNENCGNVKFDADKIQVDATNPKHTWDASKGEKYSASVCDRTVSIVTVSKFCSVCEKWIVVSSRETNDGHDFEYAVTKEPACAVAGKAVKTCKNCDYKVEITIEAPVHVGGEYKAEADFNGKVVEKSSSNKLVDKKISGKTIGSWDKSYCYLVQRCTVCDVAMDAKYSTNEHTVKQEVLQDYDSCGVGTRIVECEDCGRVDETTVGVNNGNHQHNGVAKKTVDGVHKLGKTLVAGYSLYDCVVCGKEYKVDGSVTNAATAHNVNVSKITVSNGTLPSSEKSDMKPVAGEYVAPTCTLAGYGKYKCSVCGYEVAVQIPALGHKYSGTEYTDKERCDTEWYTYQRCERYSVCKSTQNKTKKAAVKKEGAHASVVIEVKLPTCFEAGYIKYGCNKCKTGSGSSAKPVVHYTEYEGMEKLDHDVNAYTTADNGETGCFADRKEYVICSTCQDIYNSYATPSEFGTLVNSQLKTLKQGIVKTTTIKAAKAHLYETVGIIEPATCHQTGKFGYTCTRNGCGAVEVTSTIPFAENNHSGGMQLQAGEAAHYYQNENGKLEIVPGKLLNINSLKYAAGTDVYDCYVTKYTWWYCEGCHREFQDPTIIDVDGNIVAPNEVDADDVVFVSGQVKHNMKVTKTTTAATCVAAGKGDYTCSECGYQEKNQPIPATGHTRNAIVNTEAGTCLTPTINYWSCTKCSGTDIEVLDVVAHEKDLVNTTVVDSTCDAWGYTKYQCKWCKTDMGSISIAKKPHGSIATSKKDAKYSTFVKAEPATCFEAGNIAYYNCSYCGVNYTGWNGQETNAEKGTVYGNTEVGVTDKVQTVVKTVATDVLKHNAIKNTQLSKTPSCTQYGYESQVCTLCDTELTWKAFVIQKAHTADVDSEGKVILTTVPSSCKTPAYTAKYCTVCKQYFDHVYDTTAPRAPHVNKFGQIIVGDCRLILGDENCACKGTGTLGWDDANGVWTECPDCAVYYICVNDICNDCDEETVNHDYCDTFVPAVCVPVHQGEYLECNANVYKCKFCGVYTDKAIDATKSTDHTMMVNDDLTVLPTVTTEGKKVSSCVICEFTVEEVVDRVPAISFDLEASNANGNNFDGTNVIVNGGKIYVTIKMTAEDVAVNGIKVSLKYDATKLTLLKEDSEKMISVFGALSNNKNHPVINQQVVNGDTIVTIYDEAGDIRENVNVASATVFVPVVFQVKTSTFIPKDFAETVVSFYNGYDDLTAADANYQYKSVVTSKDGENYYDYNFAYGESITIKIKQLGDANDDGLVDSKDVSAVADLAVVNFSEVKYDAVLDIDHNGVIDFEDYRYIKLFQVPGNFKTDANGVSEFYDVAVYEARLQAEAEAAAKKDKDNV